MGKINFVLTKFIFWPIYAIVAILVSSFVFKPGDVFQGYTNGAFYLIASVGIVLSIIYWILEHKNNKIIAHPVYFPLMLFLLTMSIAIVWLQKNETFVNPDTNFTVETMITNEFRIKCTIVLTLFFNAIYMLLFTVSRRTFRLQQTFWFIRLFVLFVIFSIIFSCIKEFDSVKAIFSDEPVSSLSIKSLFYNENFFACVLLFGMIGLMVLNYYKSRPYNYIFMFAFYFYMILTTCTTSLLVGTVALILYILLDIVSAFKKHWIVATVMLSVFFIAFAGIGIGIYLLYSNDVSWIKSFITFIEKQIFDKDFQTFTGRTEVWKTTWDYLIATDPISMLFGRGYGTGTIMIRTLFFCMNNGNPSGALTSAHNGIIEILYTNGLVGLSLYGVLIFLVLVAFVLLLVKKKVKFAFMYLLIISSVLCYSMFESHFFFGQSMFNMVLTIFALMPMFNAVRALYKPKIAKPIINGDYHYVKMNYLKLKSFVTMIFIPVFFPSLFIILDALLNKAPNEVIYSQLRLLSYFVVAIIFTPQIISLFYKSATKRRFVFRCIFYSCLLLILVVFTPYACFLLRPISNIFYWVELAKLIVFTAYLFIIWLVFTLVKRESVYNYLKYTFLEPLKGVAITLPLSFIFGALGILLFKGFNLVSPLTTFAITVTTIIIYYVLFALIPSIKNYYYINFFNERCLYNLKINYQKFEI